MSNAGVRVTRLRSLAVRDRQALATAKTKAEWRLVAAKKLAESLEADVKALEREIERSDDRLKELDEWKKEPVVLVRSSAGGYGMPVYHDGKEPCGFGRALTFPHR